MLFVFPIYFSASFNSFHLDLTNTRWLLAVHIRSLCAEEVLPTGYLDFRVYCQITCSQRTEGQCRLCLTVGTGSGVRGNLEILLLRMKIFTYSPAYNMAPSPHRLQSFLLLNSRYFCFVCVVWFCFTSRD
jgi:hypothetical protein